MEIVICEKEEKKKKKKNLLLFSLNEMNVKGKKNRGESEECYRIIEIQLNDFFK